MKILLLDANWYQTSYLVTELHDAGADVVLASPMSPDPKGLGRWCRQITSPSADDPTYGDFLFPLLARESFDLVLPLCEPLQQLLWTAPGPLNVSVFPETTALQREVLTDRRRLYALAEQIGVPVPRMLAIADQAALPATIDALGLPLVLRGTQGMSGEQVRIARSPEAARAAFDQLRAASPEPPFAQEFLDGRRCLIGAVMQHGHAVQWFSQRTIESCPPPTGPSIRVESLVDPVLTAHAARLFEAIAWDGIACAEFIQLGRGDYRLLEINPRPWAAIRAAHSCGVPLLRLFARYLCGQPVAGGVAFGDGQECTLFPAFITARLRWGGFPRMSDTRAYVQMLRAAPWGQPALLRHFLRIVWWAANAPKLTAPATADGPQSSSASR